MRAYCRGVPPGPEAVEPLDEEAGHERRGITQVGLDAHQETIAPGRARRTAAPRKRHWRAPPLGKLFPNGAFALGKSWTWVRDSSRSFGNVNSCEALRSAERIA